MLKTGSRCLSVLLLLMTITSRCPAQAENDVQNLATSNNAFALDLYGKLATTDGNLFFSPYSISACLAMTYAGASGNTALQMAQTLHFSTNQTQFASAFGQLQQRLTATEQKKDIAMNVANGLWAQKGHPFLPAFLDVARNTYQAAVNQVDFHTQAEPIRQTINGWVSQQTQGKINDLLQPGTVDATTRLILVNAIYFKGQWSRPFNKTNTAPAPFTTASGQSVQTPLMHLTAQFKYGATNDLQLLELPYGSGDLAMDVLLPKDVNGLKIMEGSINQQTLTSWLAHLHEQRVDVFLPKFKLTAQFSLGKTLASMGMTDAFSSAADFSGMDGTRDLFLSAVVHKAFVDVNEEGTEAAAATGSVMKTLAIRPQPTPTFRVDHPFVFLIRDTRSGSILFLGRVTNPTRG